MARFSLRQVSLYIITVCLFQLISLHRLQCNVACYGTLDQHKRADI
jgi:hypothetical protein